MVIVVFSGVQGSGKSTLAENISLELNKQSIPNFIYQEHVDQRALEIDLWRSM